MLGSDFPGEGVPLDVEIGMDHLEYLMQMFDDMDADMAGGQEGVTAPGDQVAPDAAATEPSQGTAAQQPGRNGPELQLPPDVATGPAAGLGDGGWVLGQQAGEQGWDPFVELKPGEPLPPVSYEGQHTVSVMWWGHMLTLPSSCLPPLAGQAGCPVLSPGCQPGPGSSPEGGGDTTHWWVAWMCLSSVALH
jgi:hypothetical protein